MDGLARIVRRPITLEDAEGRLLAYSVHDGPVDPVRLETLLRRGASEATLGALKKRGVYECVDSAPGIARVGAIPDIGFDPRICVCIRGDSGVVGYLWAMYRESIVPAQIEAAILSARDELARVFNSLATTGGFEANLVKDLIGERFDPATPAQRIFEERMRALGVYSLGSWYALVLRPAKQVGSRAMEALLEHLARSGACCLQGTFNDEVVFLVSTGRTLDASGLAGVMKHHCITSGFVLGVSSQRRNLGDLSDCYAEASKAIKIGQEAGSGEVFDYTVLALHELVSCVASLPLPQFGRRLVESLADYDKHRRTELLRTLEIYLDHFGDRKGASEHLDVHPNTLDYRIRRIQEIIGVDLGNADLRLVVHLWTKIFRFCRSSFL